MRRVVILRPEPGAGETEARARAMGLDPVKYPLFAPVAIAWEPPAPEAFDALLLTSANGVQMAGPALANYRALAAYGVGEATALALRRAGFVHAVAGGADASAIAARIAADGHGRVLHLSGAAVAPMDAGSLIVRRIPVYAMRGLPVPEGLADAPDGAAMLVHSSRAGERLAAIIPEERRAGLHLIAISTAALAASGAGWRSAQAPDRPRDDEMLALAARLCE